MPLLYIPANFGETVYKMHLGCDSICIHQRALTNKINDDIDAIHCRQGMYCYTVPDKPFEVEVNFDNLRDIISKWGVEIFATKEEAMAAATKKAKENQKELEKYGARFSAEGRTL